jgi:hypothetical protein
MQQTNSLLSLITYKAPDDRMYSQLPHTSHVQTKALFQQTALEFNRLHDPHISRRGYIYIYIQNYIRT